MIELSLSNVLLFPMVTALVLVVALWFYYSVRGSAQAAPTESTRIYRCAVCAQVYVDARDLPLARCTRCGCLNEAVKR